MERSRLVWLDVLKGAAIVLVVFNHALLWPMRSGDRLAAFAYGIAFGTVAAFSAVAGYLAGLHPPAEPQRLLKRRAAQLLAPWALWAPVYAAAPLVWDWLGGGKLPVSFKPGPWALGIALGGGPLWFLPVLFVATGLCTLLDRRTRSWWPAIVALAAYATLTLVASLAGISPLALGRGTFWPVAPLYVASYWFGLRVARDGTEFMPEWALGAVVLATMSASGYVTLQREIHPEQTWLMWFPYAIGAVGGWAALVLATKEGRPVGPLARGIARFGEVSLGAYVLHPALVGPLMLVLSTRTGVAGAAMAAAVGTAAAAALARWARDRTGVRHFV